MHDPIPNITQRIETAGMSTGPCAGGSLVTDALSDLARLSLAGSTPAELAARGIRWLERMVPGCRAVMFMEAVAGSDEMVVLTGTGAAGTDVWSSLPVGSQFIITRASREPLEVFTTGPTAADGGRDRPLEHPIEQPVLTCAGIGHGAEGLAVIAALSEPHEPGCRAEPEEALRILASQLAVGLSLSKNRATALGASDGIVRAKLEWERTVDALADIVCLLDAEGGIVRANRAIERWGLGRVHEVIGKPVREMFHPACGRPGCALCSALGKASQELLRGSPCRFEYHDEELDRDLHFDVRPLLADAATRGSASEANAVLVVADVSELRRVRDALHQLNASLECRVRGRTQELREANRGLRNEVLRRKAVEAALRESNSERGLLSEQLIVAQEEERRRIARELHDAVGQPLSAVKYSIEQAMEMLRRPGLGDTLPVLARAVRNTLDAAESIRTIAASLRPSVLDDMGSASAVAGLCQQFAAVYRGIDVHAQITASDADVPDRLATALFRSAQELLNNVAKHAHAGHVAVVLRRELSSLVLEVHDDGVGITDSRSATPTTNGHGLRNLRERAELTGGHFEVSPGSAGGTVARLSWPLLPDEVSGRDAR